MRISDFEWGVMKDGEFKGRRYVKLKDTHNGQKGNDLSMANTTCKNDKDFQHIPYPETDDPLGVFNLLYRQIYEYMPPGCSEERIFHRQAPDKLLEVR